MRMIERWGLRAAAWACLGLAACAASGPPKADDSQVRAYAARGYQAALHDRAVTSADEWTFEQQPQPLLLTLPEGAAAPLPLVVYLPGLGEDAGAGKLWREAWAEAGYAVLSLQPLADDEAAFRSEQARSGEFKALGRERWAAAAMVRRVARLTAVVAQARERGARGEPPWNRLDWSRVAIAGYDLGAHAALVLAGERDGSNAVAPVSPRAVIAISPDGGGAAAGVAARRGWADIHVPALLVSSDEDGDPLGLIASPAQRLASFDAMPGPDQDLLLLHQLPHLRLSGLPSDEIAAPPAEAAPRSESPGPGGRRRGGNGGGATAVPDSDRALADVRGFGAGAGGGLSATATELRLVAVRAVTTAFLDAHLRGDARARAWLAERAGAWLGRDGELRRRP